MKSDLYEDASQKVAELAGDLESSIRQAIKDLTTTPHGREFLWWLLEITTLKVETFYGNSKDAFFAGKRSVGREIEHRLAAASPEVYVSMIKAGEVKT